MHVPHIMCTYAAASKANLLLYPPLPSTRQHLRCDDCVEDKRKDDRNCSVLNCVQCTNIVKYNHEHTHNETQMNRGLVVQIAFF